VALWQKSWETPVSVDREAMKRKRTCCIHEASACFVSSTRCLPTCWKRIRSFLSAFPYKRFFVFFCAMQLHSLLQAARPPAQLLIAWNHQPHEQTLPPRHNPSRSTGVKLNLWSDRKGRKPTSLFSAFTREWRLSTSLRRPTSWQAEVKSDRPLEFY